MRPYRSSEDRIGGIVITLFDITAQKRAAREIADAKEHAERVVNSIDEPLVILTPGLRVHSANRAFYASFRVTPENTVGRLIYELGNRQWDIPLLRTLLEDVSPQNSVVNDFEVIHRFEKIGERVMLLNARRLDDSELLLLGFRDVTALKLSEQSLLDADRRKDEFLATLAHELRNPLAAITGPSRCREKLALNPRRIVLGRSSKDRRRTRSHVRRPSASRSSDDESPQQRVSIYAR
jgi:two-component system CheB/CheR fusion protein